jgi:hypothetical protein
MNLLGRLRFRAWYPPLVALWAALFVVASVALGVTGGNFAMPLIIVMYLGTGKPLSGNLPYLLVLLAPLTLLPFGVVVRRDGQDEI